MGAEFHRLVMAALAAGLLVIPGCGAGDGTKTSSGPTQDPPAVTQAVQPKIVAASLEGTGTLRVTYSEAMKPPVGVDPAKFRLTVAYYTRPASASAKYTYKYYAAYTPYSSGKGYGYGYAGPEHTIYGDVAPVTSLAADATHAEQAVLELGGTFDVASACQEIQLRNQANPNAHAGLYLHYSEAGSPTVEDPQGNKLASLAAYWSTDPTLEQVSGDFVGKPIPVALTCN
jgi:hypothetical protein